MKKWIFAIALMLSATVHAAKSDKVFVSVVPANPIVFTAPISYMNNGTSVTVTPPWFRFGVNLDNESGDNVTVISITAKITGLTSVGAPATVTTTFDPSIFNYSNSTQNCNYFSFGTFADKEQAPLNVSDAGAACASAIATFYAGSLPDLGTGFYNYNVTLQVDGWFGTADRPTTRFQKIVQFQAQ